MISEDFKYLKISSSTMNVCCVVCEMKEAAIPVSVIQQLLNADTDVRSIALMESPPIKRICQRLSPSQMVILKNAARRTIDGVGVEAAQLIHPRYHQRTVLEVDGLSFQRLHMGTILQVLDDSWPPVTAWNIISNLIDQSVWSYAHESKYPTLSVRMNNAVTISFRHGDIEDHRSNGFYQYMEGVFGGLSVDEKLDDLERFLTPMDRPSMVVFYGAQEADEDESPSAQRWIDFLYRIYGELDDMWVILVFSGARFPGRNLEMTPAELLRNLNRNSSVETTRNSKLIHVNGETAEEFVL